jgi:transposase
MVLKVRESLVGQRTVLVNALRRHAAEFGVIAGTGLGKIGPLLAAIEQEAVIPPEAKDMARPPSWASRLPILTPRSRKSK